MKTLFSLLLCLITYQASAQVFSFQDTSTTLIKTTDQSPAHWYLEIFNDISIDTTLRWKASFDPALPTQWVITFDDQNNFYNPVNDGDSADFTLYANPAFPQKLIIGAILNNTAGTASVYFDIYDPANPSVVQTIEYRFVISMGSGTWGTEELSGEEQWFTQSGRSFEFPDEFHSNEVVLYDLKGNRVCSKSIESSSVTIPTTVESGVYFITMKSEHTFYSTRVVL